MFNSWIKNINNSLDSLPKITAIQNTLFEQTNNQSQFDVQIIIDEILTNLSLILSEKLGEKIEAKQFKEISAELLKSKSLENHLIEIKQKYNQLVNRSTNIYQNARKISNSIGQFIASINLFLQSQELLIPLKEIQKGINEIQPEKVQKQINYLIKIFQQNFNELLNKKIIKSQENLSEEIKLLRNLNKNLQGEIISVKNSKNNEESKYLELTLKIGTLNEKIARITNEKIQIQKQLRRQQGKVHQTQRNGDEIGKQFNNLKLKQKEYVQKIRVLDIKLNRSEKIIKQQKREIEMLSNVIEKLKFKQEQIVEQMQIQSKKKEGIFEMSRKKIYNEKSHVQQKLSLLSDKYSNLEVQLSIKQQQYKNLNQELNQLKSKGFFEVDIDNLSQNHIQEQEKSVEDIPIQNSEKKEHQKISLNELMSKLNYLQNENKSLNDQLTKENEININKQVFKNLFMNYDDESKQWSVRRNIKNQIYVLLNVSQKIQKVKQNKNSGWFGLF